MLEWVRPLGMQSKRISYLHIVTVLSAQIHCHWLTAYIHCLVIFVLCNFFIQVQCLAIGVPIFKAPGLLGARLGGSDAFHPALDQQWHPSSVLDLRLFLPTSLLDRYTSELCQKSGHLDWYHFLWFQGMQTCYLFVCKWKGLYIPGACRVHWWPQDKACLRMLHKGTLLGGGEVWSDHNAPGWIQAQGAVHWHVGYVANPSG